jgi:Tol biopolymer transport system component
MAVFATMRRIFFSAGPRAWAPLLLSLLLAASEAGAALVFSALVEGSWHLYYQADPGVAPRAIQTPGITGDRGAPRLSPDGAEVAFEVTGEGIHVCPLAGDAACRAVKLEQGYPVRPAWNPRTGELVFAHFTFRADEELSTLKRADRALVHIEPVVEQTGIQDFPDVSADARRMAYTSWLTVMPYRGAVRVVQQLWTLDLTRGRAQQLLMSNASDIHPRWSPDGTRIAFSSNRGGGYEIWVAASDGSDPRPVTHGPGKKTWPVWSPDGARVLYTHSEAGRARLSLVDLDTGIARAYSPFGEQSDIQLKDADWRAVSD